MAGTIGECITEARTILQDVDGPPYRYTDAQLYEAFSAAMAEARRLRPDFFVGQFEVEDLNFTTDDALEPFPLPVWYWPSISSYIVGRAELREDQFSTDGRAVALLQRFAAQLLTPGV